MLANFAENLAVDEELSPSPLHFCEDQIAREGLLLQQQQQEQQPLYTAELYATREISEEVLDDTLGGYAKVKAMERAGIMAAIGRPDVNAIIRRTLADYKHEKSELVGEAGSSGGSFGARKEAEVRAVVFACGPESLVRASRDTAIELGMQFRAEAFQW